MEAPMPTYQYACTECGERLEVVQKFSDEPLTVCPACEGRLRKVFSPVGVVFKGSGFYKTDSRPSSSSGSKPDKPDKAEKTDKAESKSETKAGADSSSSGSSESKSSEPKPAASSGGDGTKVA
jgi:putative FmdB family regulatory protein